MIKKVTVVDYGMGNLLSVMRAFQSCGVEALISQSVKEVAQAEYLVLPGVGAFPDGIAALKKFGLDAAIHEYGLKERPFLGICLGMQMMLSASEEFGRHQGLNLIPGEVKAVPAVGVDGKPHKVPHVGWNKLVLPSGKDSWDGTLLRGIPLGSFVYFVHSYGVYPDDSSHRLADCDYDGCIISAAIARNQFTGCQFHPEKSGPVGLGIINNFLGS